MVCSPPGSSVHGIFQARILEWVAMLSSKGSPQPRHPASVSYVSGTGRRVFLPLGPPGKPECNTAGLNPAREKKQDALSSAEDARNGYEP